MLLKRPFIDILPDTGLTNFIWVREECSGSFASYKTLQVIPKANLETLAVTQWSMQKDTAPSATALFLNMDSTNHWRARDGQHVHMTIRTANNQTVGREILLQLREKPITGCETTNEEHRLQEGKEEVSGPVATERMRMKDDKHKSPLSMHPVVP
jgi:hypothetical protein